MSKKKILFSLILVIISIIILNSSLDITLLEKITETRSENINIFFIIFTHLGSWRFLAPFSLIIFIFFKNKKYRLPLSLGILLASLFNTIIKYIIRRPRPSLAPLLEYTSYSYPSGHTMVNAVFMYFLYKYLFDESKRVIIPLLLYSLLMAYSRLYLGVHYPSDIIGGYAAAFVFVTIFDYIFENKFNVTES